MITTQPVPTIPLWAWELAVPFQLAMSAGYLWVHWWLMCSKNRLNADTNGRQLAYASLGMVAAVTIFLFGSIFAGGQILDPTHNPKIGVYGYWFVMPSVLVTLATAVAMLIRKWTIWGYWTDPRLNPGRRPQAAARRGGTATQVCYPDRPAPAKPHRRSASPAEGPESEKPPAQPPPDNPHDGPLP